MIDTHTHIGDLSFAPDWPTLTAEVAEKIRLKDGMSRFWRAQNGIRG
ncbi:MAG: hypothetical protein VCF25_02255 [Candidatus Poribacteria bacterium]